MADTGRFMLSAAQALLKSNLALKALVGERIYGQTPAAPVYPFVLVSSPDAKPFAAADFAGFTHTLRLQAFSRDDKPGTAYAIRSLIFDTLNRNEPQLQSAGQKVVMIENQMADAFLEDDGRTWQSVLEFAVTIDQ